METLLEDIPREIIIEISHFVANECLIVGTGRGISRTDRDDAREKIVSCQEAVINIRNWSLVSKQIKSIIDSLWITIRRDIWNIAILIKPRRLLKVFDKLQIPRYHELAVILYFMNPKEGFAPIVYKKFPAERRRVPGQPFPSEFINKSEHKDLVINRGDPLKLSRDGNQLVCAYHGKPDNDYDSYIITIKKFRGQGLRGCHNPRSGDIMQAFTDAREMKSAYMATRKEMKMLQGKEVRKLIISRRERNVSLLELNIQFILLCIII